MWRWILYGFFFLVFIVAVRLYFYGLKSQEVKSTSGLKDGRLPACSNKPNCVSSQANPADRIHYLKAADWDLSIADKKKRLLEFFEPKKRFQLEADSDNYLHYTYRSPLFGFVDDMEFLLTDKLLHFRSTSRVGHSDLGKNRERVESILKSLGLDH